MGLTEGFPRDLSAIERKLLLWILPADRPGYADYRNAVDRWKLVGTRPRVEDSFLLAPPGEVPEFDGSQPQVVAVGAVEDPRGVLNISVRELQPHQLEFELSGPVDQEVARDFEGFRRWTLSSWSPTNPCPSCGGRLREVAMTTRSGPAFALSFCVHDHRLWIFDGTSGMNLPIPVTGFYNELMLQAKIQDPDVALRSRRLFSDLDTYSNDVLTRAFEAYNRTRRRVGVGEAFVLTEDRPASLLMRLKRKIIG